MCTTHNIKYATTEENPVNGFSKFHTRPNLHCISYVIKIG